MINTAQWLGSLTKFAVKGSSGVLFVVKREQLKGHHTIDNPAGRSHPDFAPPNPLWEMIRQILIDDILCAEALIRIWFGVVRDCIDGLSHVTVWFGLSTEDLAPSCSGKLNKVILRMVFEVSPKKEVTSIKQLWQQLFSVEPASLWSFRNFILFFLLTFFAL